MAFLVQSVLSLFWCNLGDGLIVSACVPLREIQRLSELFSIYWKTTIKLKVEVQGNPNYEARVCYN